VPECITARAGERGRVGSQGAGSEWQGTPTSRSTIARAIRARTGASGTTTRTGRGRRSQRFERPYLESLFARLAADRPNGRYLDFACGTGRILDVGAARFEDVTGIDVSEAMVAVARRKRPSATIVCADVLFDPIVIDSFDVITLFRFLVRARELREPILGWLRTVVRDDGVLVVNNHRNAASLRGLAFRIRRRFHPTEFDSEILSDSDVVALLGRTGFEVVEEYGFGLVPSFRGHLLLPQSLIFSIESRLAGSGPLARLAKNRIYVCRPIPRR
jgi:SAM-dependent methyltransferase